MMAKKILVGELEGVCCWLKVQDKEMLRLERFSVLTTNLFLRPKHYGRRPQKVSENFCLAK
jgi:hypothetical protein